MAGFSHKHSNFTAKIVEDGVRRAHVERSKLFHAFLGGMLGFNRRPKTLSEG